MTPPTAVEAVTGLVVGAFETLEGLFTSVPVFIGGQLDKVFAAALSKDIMALSSGKSGAIPKARAALLSTAARKLPAKTLYPAIIRLHASLDGKSRTVSGLGRICHELRKLTLSRLDSPFSVCSTCSRERSDTARRPTLSRTTAASSSYSLPSLTSDACTRLRSTRTTSPRSRRTPSERLFNSSSNSTSNCSDRCSFARTIGPSSNSQTSPRRRKESLPDESSSTRSSTACSRNSE